MTPLELEIATQRLAKWIVIVLSAILIGCAITPFVLNHDDRQRLFQVMEGGR